MCGKKLLANDRDNTYLYVQKSIKTKGRKAKRNTSSYNKMKGLGRDKIYTMESYFYKANCFQACRIGSTIITIDKQRIIFRFSLVTAQN